MTGDYLEKDGIWANPTERSMIRFDRRSQIDCSLQKSLKSLGREFTQSAITRSYTLKSVPYPKFSASQYEN